MKKTLIATALALCLAALTAPDAAACGPYGAQAPEQEARWDVYAALDQHKVTRWVSDVDVALQDGRRGEATIRYKNGKKLVVGLFKYRNRWMVVRRARAHVS